MLKWKWNTTERLHFHFSLSCIGGGNGNPLQCSCLENPRDWGAWWAAVYGVARSRTRLKRLSSSSSRNAQACSLFSLSSLVSGKKIKKTHSSFFLSFFFLLFTATNSPIILFPPNQWRKGKRCCSCCLAEDKPSVLLFDNHQLLSPGAHLSPTSNFSWETWTPRNLYWGDEGQMVIFCNFFNADMGLIDPI